MGLENIRKKDSSCSNDVERKWMVSLYDHFHNIDDKDRNLYLLEEFCPAADLTTLLAKYVRYFTLKQFIHF
jgi:hypothetical protein